MKKLLTIAGSDSIGGAGIQADLKTFSAFGCYGMSVITAVTAQNTVAVYEVQTIDPAVLAGQMRAVFEDVPPDAVKIGMLSNPETIHTVAEGLKQYRPSIVVLDPVMVSKSGYPLLEASAMDTLKQELLPLATLLTPNLPEAELLCGTTLTTDAEIEDAAKSLVQMGAKAVLIKGGHREGSAKDLLYDGHEVHRFCSDRIETKNTHGTGCTLSSAIASTLAKGYPLPKAVALAKDYIQGAIQNALDLGAGCGPTNHFYRLWKQDSIPADTDGKGGMTHA